MKLMKFGGSSLSTPERLRKVAAIVWKAAERERVVVVVSAFQGVTNQLLECAHLAEAGTTEYRGKYRKLARRHRDALNALLIGRRSAARGEVDQLLGELEDALQGIHLLRDAHPRALDLVASFGERLSAVILAAYLSRKRSAVAVDARRLIVTDDQFTAASVLHDPTQRAIASFFKRLSRRGRPVLPVVTGFIAATQDGRTTTLGRNGSDYTASIVGAALGARVIEIWTDVDGILSADPRAVPGAFVLPEVSYEEAMELSYFGAKVLHSASIAPAVARQIPLLIKNTLHPTAPGTWISSQAGAWEGVAKGITSVDGITLLTLRGLSMVGVPGTSERLFRGLAVERVNVILISQASSEHTICFAVLTTEAASARRAIAREFQHELSSKLTWLDEKPEQTIVAIVGEGMRGTAGVAGKVFAAVGRHGISVTAIAQGASERNISFVIDSSEARRALNVIHEAFFEKRKKLAVFIIGVGNIGQALLEQLHRQRPYLLAQGFDVRVCGLADSRRLAFRPEGLDLGNWRREIETSKEPMDPEGLARRAREVPIPNLVLVDCTASSKIVQAYPKFIEADLHIITPNKKANVLPTRRYEALMDLVRKRQKHFLYEANVGAGLPIISTLRDLVASGDTLIRIEGLFSGTLSYLFNHFDASRPFSEVLREAHALGYTEPDPREDLSGQDVARKLLILGRQLDWKMSLSDIQVENLVPQAFRGGTFGPSFYRRYARRDAEWNRRYRAARAKGKVLRYVGTLAKKRARAELQEISPAHPFSAARGSDNIIAFTTARYSKTPLVVQGPGAGAEVTAMGVFSDLLKLLHYLPS